MNERTAMLRLDWRFLLATPDLESVGFVGKADTGLLAALRRMCRSVDVIAPASQHPDPEPAHDLVVACEPSAAELRCGAGRVQAGGTLVIELRGPLQPPGRTIRTLARLGFRHARSYWHWPDFERCTRIVALEDTPSVAYALSRIQKGKLARFLAQMALGLQRAGLLAWMVRSATIVARRARPEPGRGEGPSDGSSPSLVQGFLSERRDRLGLDASLDLRAQSCVALTPRFRNSSRVVFFLLAEGRREPVLVAKVARLPGPSESMKVEAERVCHIQRARPRGFDSIPRVVAFETWGGRTILVETALRGRAMDRAIVRRRTDPCCAAALAWLTEVQDATRWLPPSGAPDLERLIEGPLRELERLLPGERSLIESTRDRVRPLLSADLPLVLEHGDLSHPNLLLDSEGRLAVADWELAEIHGLPATDLFFFLTYVARARDGARSAAEVVRALERGFFARRAWARGYVNRYAGSLGIPSSALTPLFIAGWMRQLAGLARRVAEEREPSPPRNDRGDGLRRDWRFEAWRFSMEHADRLDWQDLP